MEGINIANKEVIRRVEEILQRDHYYDKFWYAHLLPNGTIVALTTFIKDVEYDEYEEWYVTDDNEYIIDNKADLEYIFG